MAAAAAEIEHWGEYDYVHRQRRSGGERRAACTPILAAERLKRERQTGLAAFVRGVLAEL